MRSLQREPALLLALLAVTALVLLFIVYPQLQVVLTPGPGGYVQFLQEGTWLVPLRNSIQLTILSTTTAVMLGFIYAYAMVLEHALEAVLPPHRDPPAPVASLRGRRR